jgi:hypothetical protein
MKMSKFEAAAEMERESQGRLRASHGREAVKDMHVRVSSGKYTFVRVFKTTRIEILRGGETWHEQGEAFNAIASMMAELDAARVVLDAARLLGEDAPIEIKRALERHRALVDDCELPSEWAAS